MNEPKTIGQTTYQTRAVVQLALDAKIGDVLTYGQLKEVIHADPQEEGRHYIQSARRILVRDHRRVLIAQTGIGYKVIGGAEVIGKWMSRSDSVRRHGRWGGLELDTVDYGELDETERLQWSGRRAQSWLIEQAAKDRTATKLAALGAPPEKKELMDPARALAALAEVIGKK